MRSLFLEQIGEWLWQEFLNKPLEFPRVGSNPILAAILFLQLVIMRSLFGFLPSLTCWELPKNSMKNLHVNRGLILQNSDKCGLCRQLRRSSTLTEIKIQYKSKWCIFFGSLRESQSKKYPLSLDFLYIYMYIYNCTFDLPYLFTHLFTYRTYLPQLFTGFEDWCWFRNSPDWKISPI